MDAENIALFDMDGTLCDYTGEMWRYLEKLRSPEEPITPEDMYAEKSKPYIKARMDMIKNQPDWWFNLPQVKLGFDVFRMALEMGYTPHVLTKGPWKRPNAWSEKVRWCQRWLGSEIQVTVTQDKGLVYGKVLVDDFPPYVERWLQWRKRGVVIMPAHVYNESFEHPNVIRYDGSNKEHVEEALSAALNRQSGEMPW